MSGRVQLTRGVEAKAFLLSSVALSAGMFNIAFWYGVFDTIFFEHLFFVWVVSVVALIASELAPPPSVPPAFLSWRGRIVLALPSLWLLLEALIQSSGVGNLPQDWVMWSLAAAVVVITLPYLTYVLVLVVVPDIDQLQTPRLRRSLFLIAAFISIAGLLIGSHHELFLTCDDFRISGSDVPATCRHATSYLTGPA